ncbi:glycosyl transferase family 8 [Terrihabitans soli]|uniref:Glycosyl transferase family 8 n=1 Tax=Terrihabitans soli TaxID=708113 RepID=A0A6S6QYP9_9HYPH|nr:glycosyltransferase family 8 protein [Terrihabitans soli]BCJ92210.1 glycosyl transferase family 8 [Terrihabitans soli]
MIIACATDENYAEMAGVFLRSLAVNGDIADADLVVVGDQLNPETVEALRLCAAPIAIRYIDLGVARRQIADLNFSFYSTATYIRLMLPDLLTDSGRVLYLDSDILINRSLRPLFDTDLGSNLAAAVEDAAPATVQKLANTRLGRPEDGIYFNAGVLLFDLDTWRDLDIGNRCIKFAEGRDDYWPDQDAINFILDGRIKKLDRTWNFFSHEPLPRGAFDAAHVIHFIPEKPLSTSCKHPLFEDYLALRAQTPWHSKPLNLAANKRRIALMHQMVAKRAKRHKQQNS